ncbi:MAG: hypothetical protein E7311_05505 [Clostridiales bacterium]|nr:hypothetical protein [Clostridiales bacterium]
MNKSLIKKILIITSIILYIFIAITTIDFSVKYSDDLISLIANTFTEGILNFGFIDIVALVLLFLGLYIKANDKYNSKVDEKKEIVQTDNIGNENKTNKNKKWKILLFIGTLPFVIIIGISIISMFTGFTFLFSTSHGISAFLDSILILSFLFWPTYIIGAVLIILSIIKLKQK